MNTYQIPLKIGQRVWSVAIIPKTDTVYVRGGGGNRHQFVTHQYVYAKKLKITSHLDISNILPKLIETTGKAATAKRYSSPLEHLVSAEGIVKNVIL